MQNNETGNTSTAQNPDSQRVNCPDWREELREWREARHRYPFHGLFLGLTLVLLGSLFLLNQIGWISGDIWWQALLIGLGVISIISGLVHYLNPEYR